MSGTSFDRVIAEHLRLSERNKRLEETMPLERYREQPAGGSAEDRSSLDADASGATGPSIAVGREPPVDPDSWWETRDGECPPPPLSWDGDY
jgi:hypothetical protein